MGKEDEDLTKEVKDNSPDTSDIHNDDGIMYFDGDLTTTNSDEDNFVYQDEAKADEVVEAEVVEEIIEPREQPISTEDGLVMYEGEDTSDTKKTTSDVDDYNKGGEKDNSKSPLKIILAVVSALIIIGGGVFAYIFFSHKDEAPSNEPPNEVVGQAEEEDEGLDLGVDIVDGEGIIADGENEEFEPNQEDAVIADNNIEKLVPTVTDSTMTLHFLDTQGDVYLLKTGEDTVLFNGGTANDKPLVDAYLKKLGVKQLTYFILTNHHDNNVGAYASYIEQYKPTHIVLAPVVLDYPMGEQIMKQLEGTGTVWTTLGNNSKLIYGDTIVRLNLTFEHGAFITTFEHGMNRFTFASSNKVFDKLYAVESGVDILAVTQDTDKYVLNEDMAQHSDPTVLLVNDAKEVSNYQIKILDKFPNVLKDNKYVLSTSGNMVIDSNGLEYSLKHVR